MIDVNNIVNNVLDSFINDYSNIKIRELKDIDDEKYNEIEINTLKIDTEIVVEFLNNNKTIIKNILITSFKKSFKFNNGLSDNLMNNDKLESIIQTIINYYFDNDIKILQSNFNINLINIKQTIFNKLINLICWDIVKNLCLLDTSPTISMFENSEKSTMLNRIQKIFLKFVIKYFEFENKKDELIDYLNIGFINEFIPINKVYKNYNKHKVFYTWEDFNDVIRNF